MVNSMDFVMVLNPFHKSWSLHLAVKGRGAESDVVEYSLVELLIYLQKFILVWSQEMSKNERNSNDL